MGSYQKTFNLDHQASAKEMGSGTLDVLATPAVVAVAENACQESVENLLQAGEATVGIEMTIKHVKASRTTDPIEVNCQLIEQTKQILIFSFTVTSNGKLLAKGEHKRAVIQVESFLSKV